MRMEGLWFFMAATKQEGKQIVTNGGRVLAVSTLADTLQKQLNFQKKL